MATVSIAQMRSEVLYAYPGADWPYKVEKMSDKQIAAIYQRLMDKKRKKGNK